MCSRLGGVSGQATLFTDDVQRLDLPDGDVTYHPGFLGATDGDRLFAAVMETTAWRQETIVMYGRKLPVPRLSAWYGPPRLTYTYSHISMEPRPWTRGLLEVKERVESAAGLECNSVLCNLYRDGRDSVAWHSDDESELGPDPVIASVSLGAARTFRLRHKEDGELRHDVRLGHGSLLVMGGTTQRAWMHQVPKTSRPVGPRINLTFRTIMR